MYDKETIFGDQILTMERLTFSELVNQKIRFPEAYHITAHLSHRNTIWWDKRIGYGIAEFKMFQGHRDCTPWLPDYIPHERFIPSLPDYFVRKNSSELLIRELMSYVDVENYFWIADLRVGRVFTFFYSMSRIELEDSHVGKEPIFAIAKAWVNNLYLKNSNHIDFMNEDVDFVYKYS